MHLRRLISRSAMAASLSVFFCPAVARAQFSSLQRNLFRGLELAGNHTFVSSPQNGPFFNDNIFAQRLEFNRAGDGYTYEQWRFFGEDSFNNPNTLDLGPLKFDLGRDPNLVASNQPIGLHTRAGFTQRFIPEVFFQQETAQRFTDVFAGTSTVQPTPIRYNITLNTGVEDLTWTGNILLSTSGRINALGFYDFNFRLTNVGTFNADGALASDQETTDFEVGPVNASGQIVLDLLASLAQAAAGGTNAAVPLRVASGAAQRDKSIDEIIAKANAGETLTDDEARTLVNHALMASLFDNPLATVMGDIPASQTVNDAITVSLAPGDPAAIDSATLTAPVPEPGTLGLLAAAWLFLSLSRITGRRQGARGSPPAFMGHR